MAIATKTKPKNAHNKKRVAAHHRQTKHYAKSYWPYLPMLLLVVGGLLLNNLWHQPAHVLGAQTDLTSQALLAANNSDRSDNHVASLSLDPRLTAAAQAKADDMVKRNYWSHVSPTGQQPWSFIATTGYQYKAAGENLAYGFSSASTVVDAWLHSPEHRANLLGSQYTQVGYGVAQSPNYVGTGPETVVVALYAQSSATLPAAAATTTLTPSTAQPVSRLQVIANAPTTGDLIVGLIGSAALLFVALRHGIAWRRLLSRGELFAVQHPRLDIGLVALAMVAFLLNQTAGFIR